MNIISDYQKKFSTYLSKYSRLISYRKPKELYKPIQYILDTDAKHIRPVLCMLACELYGCKNDKALNAALSVELFHTFSLVHDDILDNSPIRRGKKTVHKKWNTNIAILSGDLMLIQSYQLLTHYSPEIAHQLLQTLSNASVLICEGQQEDMNFEKRKKINSQEYLEMIRKKTGVLLGTSLKMGSIIAGANKQQQEIMYKIGENIGIAFQIMDDYLDAFGDTSVFGKKTGNDILTNKKTFLLTKAMELADKKQLSNIYQIINMPPSTEKIKKMKNIFINLSVDKLVLQTVKDINKKNYNLFNKITPENKKIKEIIIELSEALMHRTK